MTKYFILNVLMLLVWILLTGAMSLGNLIFGYSISFFILWIISRSDGDTRYFTRIPEMLFFMLSYLGSMFKANVEVLSKVLSKKIEVNPAIIRFPLDAKTDFEITVLSNLISLTPGTLVLDLSEDRNHMYIHVMNLKDKESFITNLKYGIERKMLNILR